MSSKTYRRNGSTVKLPEGFSWTTFVFGLFPSFLKGHWNFMFLALCMDLASCWVSTSVLQGLDFFAVPILGRVLLAWHRNGELATFYRREGWSSKEITPQPILTPASNDAWNMDL